jgi:carbamoyltransferase
MNILGVSDSLTSGAAVVVDGRIKAVISEERLSREKMAMGFPYRAIGEALRVAGLEPGQIDRVAVATLDLYWRPEPKAMDGFFDADWGTTKEMMLKLSSVLSRATSGNPAARRAYYRLKSYLTRKRHGAMVEQLKQRWGITAPVGFVEHHLSHAAGAYYTSGLERATVATLDGAGDGVSARVYRVRDGEFEPLVEIDSFDSIGNYYAYVTHLCGFKAHRHEGKITGLAAFGEPEYKDILRSMIRYENGRIVNVGRAYHSAAIRKLEAALPRDFSHPNLACSIQDVLEEAAGAFVTHWHRESGEKDLALAGGVVANVKLNQRLHDLPDVERIFIHPGMGDEGLALGAALMAARKHEPEGLRPEPIQDVYLGPGFDDATLEKALTGAGVSYKRPADLADQVAGLLVANNVVARFDGRMEYGPRALGNRSILYEAKDPSVNTWLNNRLRRTEFMPFAPVTQAEHAAERYVGMSGAEHTACFMTITFDGTQALKDESPACVHVDGTARPQIIHRESNPAYYDILEAYRRRTGIPTIVNTSFNMHEEPIVCTPEDAVRTWQQGHLDALVLGPFLVTAEEPAVHDRER